MAAGSGTAGDPAELVGQARGGSVRAVARLLSLIERDDDIPRLRAVAAALSAVPPTAAVIGLTGAPGVGKSTSTSALVTALRARGQRVGVLAVDPSSPYSGGALLGDRIRMQEHAGDPGVFIRSMATRGHLGGLSAAVPQALRVLDAGGFATVLLETVGVGQSEVDVAALVDTTVVLVAPGMGDGIQAAKAGLLEIGDVFVVNKADRDGAGVTARDLRQMLARADRPAGAWVPPVLATVATRGEGVDELADALAGHAAWLAGSGQRRRRRVRRAADEVVALALAHIRARLVAADGGELLRALADEVSGDGGAELDPYTAADRLLRGLDG